MKILLIINCCLFSFLFGQNIEELPKDNKKIRMAKKWNLIEYLDLNEEQSTKFFVIMNKFQKEIKAIHKKNKILQDEMNDLLNRGVSRNEIDNISDKFFNNELEIIDLRRKHHREIEDVLTLEQTLKYLIFEGNYKQNKKDKMLDKHNKKKNRNY